MEAFKPEEYVREHVHYEIESLQLGYKVALHYPPDKPEHRVAVEAMLLHIRNLEEFLGRVKNKQRPDDIRADEICGNWQLKEFLPNGGFNRISQALQHLTKARVGADEFSGKDLQDYCKGAAATMKDWAGTLTAPCVSDSVRLEIEQECDKLSELSDRMIQR